VRKRSFIIAAGLLVVALALWFVSPLVAARLTTPVHRSFPVVTGQHVMFSFVPKLAERHYIKVEFERNLPFPRLQQIVGPVSGEPTSRPQIEFFIETQGQRVPIQPERGQNWGSLVGFTLGSFEAIGGERYTLTADVRSAEPDLQKLNGQLFVSVHPWTGEKFYFRILAARLLAITFVIVSAFVFFLGVAYSRGLRKCSHSSTPSHESHDQA
jgi:hypothetical protein